MDEDFIVICPVCGKECDELYFDIHSDCVGCGECIRKKDYLDLLEEDRRYA